MVYIRLFSLFLMCWILNFSVYAADNTLRKTVTLQAASGDSINIASIQLQKQRDGSYTYELDIDHSKFSNHFLSMRPFKCFQGPSQMLCHLPYPYSKTSKLSKDDLQDLEYDLLFIHRKSTDYGIDPWNGLYYKLSLHEDAKLTGQLKEVDLDILASPPDKGVTRPITDKDLNAADPDSHSYPTLVIQ